MFGGLKQVAIADPNVDTSPANGAKRANEDRRRTELPEHCMTSGTHNIGLEMADLVACDCLIVGNARISADGEPSLPCMEAFLNTE